MFFLQRLELLPAGLSQSSVVREGCLRLSTLLWHPLSEVYGPIIESKGAILVPSSYDPFTIKTLTDAWLTFSGWQDFSCLFLWDRSPVHGLSAFTHSVAAGEDAMAPARLLE